VSELYLVDAGPIVSLLIKGDTHHGWATSLFGSLRPPLLTCDAVLAEAAHVVAYHGGDPACIPEMVARGALATNFHVGQDPESVARLMRRYRNVPMSLADACLVRMSELKHRALIVTTDNDFHIYRRHGRQAIPLRLPF